MLESASWLGVAETTGISPIRRTADHEQVNKGLIVHNTIPQIIQNTIRSIFDKSSKCLVVHRKGKTRPESSNKNCQCPSYCQARNWRSYGILVPFREPWSLHQPKFCCIYWKSYVTEVLKAWKQDGDVQSDKVILLKNVEGEFIGFSTVDDYIYRSYELSDKSLDEWIQIYKRLKRTKADRKNSRVQNIKMWNHQLSFSLMKKLIQILTVIQIT